MGEICAPVVTLVHEALLNPGLSQPGSSKPGVIDFPGLIVALPDRAKAGLPGRVAGDDLGRAVRVKQVKLREQPRLRAVKVLAVEGAISTIPTVAQDGSHGVGSLLQQ